MSDKKKASTKADQIELVTELQFKDALKKVLGTTKKESDEQMEKFQASNAARREGRAKRES